MIVNDRIHKEFTITSPIILELINTKAFKRLKNVSQFGVPNKYHHLTGYSRYEHSIGVYILLNKLQASQQEQVAGLLHDVSHTAFSHIIDWVIGEDKLKEDYQDRKHLSILKQEEIAGILNKYGLSTEDIANFNTFTLLDKEMPDLCVDRIDYSLREFPLNTTEEYISDLKVYEKEIVFTTEKTALQFAEGFLDRQIKHWGGYESATRYNLFSKLLRKAIDNKVISLSDFYKTEKYILDKIIKTKNKEYLELLKVLESKDLSYLPKSEVSTQKKFRHVDPKVLINGKPKRLSTINRSFCLKLQEARELNEKGIKTGILAI